MTTLPSSLARPSARSRPGLVLAVILTCQLMVVLDATIVNVALPEIRSALDFSPTALAWVVDAYTLVFGGLLLLGARAGDLIGRRRTFLLGISVFTAASLAGGLATSASFLLATRAVQGLGAAFAAPSALALLMVLFPEGRARARAIGWYAAVSVGGIAVGLLAGGMLVQWLSWRWVLFVNVPIGVAVILAARRSLAETPRRHGRFDLVGALASTVSMGSLVYGFVHAATAGWASPVTVGAFLLGGALLGAFLLNERSADEPITPLRLFADRNRSASYLARLLLVAGMYGVFFFLTQLLQNVLGYSPLLTGLAFLPLAVSLFLASQVSARLAAGPVPDKVVMVVGLSLSTVALFLLVGISGRSDYLQLLVPLVLFGTGNGLAFVPLTSLSIAGVDAADAGAASGLVNVIQQIGGAVGLAVLVSVFGAATRGAVRTAPAHASSVVAAHHVFVVGADQAFLVAAVFVAAAAVLVLLAVSRPGRRAAGAALEAPAVVDREADALAS